MKPSRVLLLAVLLCVSQEFEAAAVPDGWHAVDPGFSVQVLLGRGTNMWAAGCGESIAVSTDAGQHWQRKHQDPKGSLLLVLHFVDEKFGYAAGTAGRVLFTQDGGESWTLQKVSDETILQAAFGDPQHGVIRTLSALQSTTNGGKTWQAISPANDPDRSTKFRFIVDLAALDKDHLAARVSEGELSDGEYLWTADGGATWTANYIPNTGIHNLTVVDGSYWSIGHEVLGKDKPRGGLGFAMAFRSHDGSQWEHISLANSVCKSESCGGCTAQGCFAGKSSFVNMADGKDWMARFPPHEGLSAEWARSGNSLCLLTKAAVECTNLTPVNSLDTQSDNPTWESRTFPPLGAVKRSNPQCIRCQLPPLFVTKTGPSGPIDLQIGFTLEASGQVDEVAIVGRVPDDVLKQLRAFVGGWQFEPFIKDGIPTRKELGMRGRIIIMNPDKPPTSPVMMPVPN